MISPTPLHALLERLWDGWYRLCRHRSHKLRLPCFRGFWMDGQCARHWDSCYAGCEAADA